MLQKRLCPHCARLYLAEVKEGARGPVYCPDCRLYGAKPAMRRRPARGAPGFPVEWEQRIAVMNTRPLPGGRTLILDDFLLG